MFLKTLVILASLQPGGNLPSSTPSRLSNAGQAISQIETALCANLSRCAPIKRRCSIKITDNGKLRGIYSGIIGFRPGAFFIADSVSAYAFFVQTPATEEAPSRTADLKSSTAFVPFNRLEIADQKKRQAAFEFDLGTALICISKGAMEEY